MEKQIENIPRSIFTKHPIHFRRPQEFHRVVYTVYVVGKELGSIVFQALLINLMSNLSWKQLVDLLKLHLWKERI